jgi:SAM-dependent methyltransferase
MTERPTMAEYWNSRAGEHWASTYERYDDLLGGYGRAAISALDAEADERILDVGCGAGGTTLDVARLLAPRGTIVGIDLSKQMIEVAQQRAWAEALTNVEFVQGDVVTHPFEDGSFDAFMSRFGVMFFDDPLAAFSRLAALLVPGGRAAFVCWQAPEANEWMQVTLHAVTAHTGMPPAPPPGAPGPFALADRERLASILDGAGFEDVFIEPVSMDQRAGADVDEALSFYLGTSTITALLSDVDEPVRDAAISSLRDSLGPHARDGGVYMSGAAWLVTAHTG